MKTNKNKRRGNAGLKIALGTLCVLVVAAGGLTGVQAVIGAEADQALTAPVSEETNGVQKTEVVYAKLTNTGSLENTYVVNTLEPTQAGTLTDFGTYEKVQNLTNASALGVSDGAVLADISDDQVNKSFSYQGDLGQQALPWNVTVSYTLDGESISEEKLAGNAGKLGMTIKITQNKQISDTAFFENYLVTATVTLGGDVARNVSAADAQVAMAGSDTQLTFMVMPGKEATFTVSADVKDFEMSGIQVAAIPFAIAFDFTDTSDLISQFSQLTDAVSQLDKGAAALAAGADELAAGMAKLTEGSSQLADGAAALYDGAEDVADGVANVSDGASGVARGASGVADGAGQLADGVAGMADGAAGVANGASGLAQGLSQYQQGLLAQAAQLQAAADALGSDSELQGAYEQAMQNYVGAFAATYAQTFAETYTQVYAQSYATAYGTARQSGASEEEAVQSAIQAAAGEAAQQAAGAAVQAAAAATQELLDPVRQALTNIATKAGYAGSLQALQGAAAGVGSADDQQSLLGGSSSLSDGAGQLADGASQLSDGAGQLADGASKLSEGAGQLADGADQLSEGTQSFANGAAQLSEGTKSLADGVGQAANGASQYATGSREYADGMGTFNNETAKLPNTIQKQIDDLLADYDKSSFVPRSFVSSKNTNVKLVQFVMSTEGISIPKEEKQEEEVQELTPLDRLLALFK